MIPEINRIIASSFDAIKKNSELTLLLLSVYSKLYLNGGRPSTCTACMKRYYDLILSTGKYKAKIMEQKTCKMKKGIVYVSALHKHFSDNNMTDELAIKLLNEKLLQERHFDTLPAGYGEPQGDPEHVEKIVLKAENLGNYTPENLAELPGKALISYAGGLTGAKPKSKGKAIEMILQYQDK